MTHPASTLFAHLTVRASLQRSQVCLAGALIAIVAGAAPIQTVIAQAARRPAAADVATVVERISAFGFDTKAGIGYGGAVMLKIFPVVLFKDGSALTDVTGLADPAGLDAHRAAHPSDWTRWRRSGGALQIAKSAEWKALAFQTTYSTLPADFRLDGQFRSVSGTGNLAVGGTSSVTVVNEYHFASDGRVLRGGAVGSTASGGDFSTVTSSARPDQRGRYTIRGITLRITWDDGSSEERILVTDPSAPTTIWLDGTGFSRRRR